MLDNEEKLKNEENKYKEQKKEEEEHLENNQDQDMLNKEKVNNNLSNDINEIGIDPLDEFMEDLSKKNNIVKQIENFDNPFDNKNTITLEEIEAREEEEENEEKNGNNQKDNNQKDNNGINGKENENDESDDDSSYHENFMNVINNALDPELKKNKKDENSTAVVMYDEDHFE